MKPKHDDLIGPFLFAGFLLFVALACERDDKKVELPVLTTLSVTEITTNSAKSGGEVTEDGGGEIVSRGTVWGVAVNPSLDQFDGQTLNGSGKGAFECMLTGLSPGAGYYVRAYATNETGTAYGNQIGFTTEEESPLGTVTDIEGNSYLTVTIGEQQWMAENLRVTKYRSGEPVDYPGSNNASWKNNTTGAYAWYNNDDKIAPNDGALYNWYAVDNKKGLCPAGWHVPTDAEWTKLAGYLMNTFGLPNEQGNAKSIGNRLKSCRQVSSPLGGNCNTTEHPRWNAHNVHYGTDDDCFSATPGGTRLVNGEYQGLGPAGYWWSSTALSSTDAWDRSLTSSTGNLFGYHFSKTNGFSVRCIKD